MIQLFIQLVRFVEQEPQLLRKSRKSAMYFFVAKLLSHRNDLLLHLSPPKPTSGTFVTHTANKLQHATTACAHDA